MSTLFPLIHPVWDAIHSIGGFYDGHMNIFVRLGKQDFETLLQLKGKKLPTPIPQERVSAFLSRYQKKGLLNDAILEVRANAKDDSILRVIEYANERGHPRKLTIELTDECNLRCSYCRYTINERNRCGRSHGYSVLNISTAKKAIDAHIEDYHTKVSKLQLEMLSDFTIKNPLTIGFYGGEVLLKKNELKELIVYAKEKAACYNLIPSLVITTNATLLDSSMIDFLVENNVYISISLDGPASENDKNRVFPNGLGSTHLVEKALQILEDNYPEYKRTRVSIQAVDAPNYDRRRVFDYFSEQSKGEAFAGVDIFRLLEYVDFNENKLSSDGNEVDDRLNGECFEHQFNQLLLFFDSIPISTPINNILLKIHADPDIKNILRLAFSIDEKLGEKPISVKPYFNSCYIGRANLFVSTNGELHVCERTDSSIPIGSVSNGIDEGKVFYLYKNFLEIMNRYECRACWAGVFCPICVAQLIKDGQVTIPKESLCEQIRHTTDFLIKVLLILSEQYPHIYDAVFSYFKRSGNITLDDYLMERQKSENALS